MFGEESVPKTYKDNLLKVTVNSKVVEINLQTLDVVCEEDEILRDMVHTAVSKLNQVLV